MQLHPRTHPEEPCLYRPPTGDSPPPEREAPSTTPPATPPPAPAPAPPRETPPPAAGTPAEDSLDSLSRTPFERFADNYREIDRLVDEVHAGARGFQEDYRSYLKSSGKWRPAGGHRTNWEGIEEFNKVATRLRRDLVELADKSGLIESGGARRWVRKARIGARDVTQRVVGNETEASLRQLRGLAADIEQQATRLGGGLSSAGVSSQLNASWTRLRTKARRVHQLLS